MHPGGTPIPPAPPGHAPGATVPPPGPPPAPPSERPAGKIPPLALLIGGMVGALLLVSLGLDEPGAPAWPSVAPPLAVLIVVGGLVLWRSRQQQAAVAASRAILADGGQPVPVRLRAQWGGSSTKVGNRLVLRRTDTGEDVGNAPVAAPDGVFDPAGPLWAHGPVRPGALVALTADDGRAPLLAFRPIQDLSALDPMAVHPSSDAINQLLGWDRPDGVPAGDVSLPPDLAATAWPTLGRLQRGTAIGLLAVWFLPLVCLVLRPGFATAVALTVAVWAAMFAWRRWGTTWATRSTREVLRAHGWTAVDARYGARALAAVRFGPGLPPNPNARSAPAAPTAAPAPPAGSGWGYAPQAAPAREPASEGAPSPWWPNGPAAMPSTLSRATVGLLVGLALVVIGAMLFAASSRSPETVSVQALVIESPTASGGVLLSVPQGSGMVVDGVTTVQGQPWETGDLDPATVEVGTPVTVQVEAGCFCNPSLDGGSGSGGDRRARGLGLVVAGVAVAIVGRFLPASTSRRQRG